MTRLTKIIQLDQTQFTKLLSGISISQNGYTLNSYDINASYVFDKFVSEWSLGAERAIRSDTANRSKVSIKSRQIFAKNFGWENTPYYDDGYNYGRTYVPFLWSSGSCTSNVYFTIRYDPNIYYDFEDNNSNGTAGTLTSPYFRTNSESMPNNTPFSRVYVSNDSVIRWKSKTDFITEIRDNGGLDSRYVKKEGDTMTGALKRYYGTTSNDPMIALTSNNLDVWLWRINHSSSASTSTSGVYGFGLKYLGSLGGNNNKLVLYSDAQNGTQVAAMSMQQDGKITLAVAPNAPGYIKDSSDDNHVLLGAGGHKEWSTTSSANTLVARDSNKDIYIRYAYATLFNTSSGDMGDTAFSRIYVSNNNFIKWQTKSKFAVEMRDSGAMDGRWVLKAGDTMNSHATLTFQSNGKIIQNQNNTTNYTIAIQWMKNSTGWYKSDGTTLYTYQPHIGQTNTGDSGTGSITILPYPTDNNPWGGKVGLYIGESSLKYNDNKIWHAGNLTKVSQLINDIGYVTSSGVTSITLKAEAGISIDVNNTAITSTGTRTITNSGVRSTTINGNHLRVNTNGTDVDLTIPYATNAGNTNKLNITGYQTDGLSFYQSENSFDGSPAGPGSWAHYIIANHGDGASYYHYTIRLPFWDVPQYRRQTDSTSNVTQWYNFITQENISSQSVNYASYSDLANALHGGTEILDLNSTSLNRNRIYFHNENASNRPNISGKDGYNSYGNIFQISNKDYVQNGTSDHWVTQLDFIHHGPIYYRQRINTQAWDPWEKIITSKDLPVGVIMMWPSSTPPTNWLICNGQSFSSSDYPELYSVLGGRIHVPDFSGRMPIGAGESIKSPTGEDYYDWEWSFIDYESKGGSSMYNLIQSQVPYHKHYFWTDSNAPDGSYNCKDKHYQNSTSAEGTGGGKVMTTSEPTTFFDHEHSAYVDNMPPYFGVYFIIKAK